MRIGFISLLLLTACSTAPKTCQQLAWEAAGQAMSNVIYQLNETMNYQEMKNNADISGGEVGAVVDRHVYDTGETSGPYSMTNYKGLSSRQAYDAVLKTCNSH